MPGTIQWRRGLLRLWAMAMLLWVVGILWSVVVPHYFAAPLTPSAIEIRRALQNQLDCPGHDNSGNTDERGRHGKCAATSPGGDSRLDITVQTANDGSLSITLGDGERRAVPRNVSAKDVADKLHQQFDEDDSRTLYEPVRRDVALVLAPPFALLLLGFACVRALRGFSRHSEQRAAG